MVKVINKGKSKQLKNRYTLNLRATIK